LIWGRIKALLKKRHLVFLQRGADRAGPGKCQKFLQGNPELMEKITQEIRAKSGLTEGTETKPEEGEEE
jgi:hypothetical protein